MSDNEEIKKLKQSIIFLLGWANSSCCSDCTPFRAAPSCIDWIHEKDCSHLETINEALVLLGRSPEVGHDYPDPEAEMKRLADERYEDCKARGLIK